MSFASKYRRKIVVEDQTFWMVKGLWDGVTLTVESAARGAKLRVGFDPIAAFYGCRRICIRPGAVRELILRALGEGWRPLEKGPMFFATCEERRFLLSDEDWKRENAAEAKSALSRTD